MTPSQLSERREPEIERRGTEGIKLDLKLVGQSQLIKKPRWLKLQEIFGQEATTELQRRILPNLRRNQEIWGETIREHLTPTTRWLDAGCGWRLLGKDLEALENELVGRARLVVGVDLDFLHLRKHINIFRRIHASLASLPFPDASFDLVTCNMVLEHLPEPLPMFQEISRVLAPGGTFLVHTPNIQNYLIFANIISQEASAAVDNSEACA